MENFYTNERNVQIILALLKAHNIRKVVASPGVANITVVGSMQCDPFFEMYSAADERSAAYIACGLAAETGEPIVLTCTGATASRNYMPGLTEAYYRKLPIVVITSSKSSYMIGQLVAQVTDRTSPPKDTVKCSILAQIIKDADDEWNCTLKVNKALNLLYKGGAGPIHINVETTHSMDFSVKKLPPAKMIQRLTINDNDYPTIPKGKIAIFVGSHLKWEEKLTKVVDDFCEIYNAVVFCDHTSNYKGKFRLLYSLPFSQDFNKPDSSQIDLLVHIGEISGEYAYSNTLNPKEVWRVNEDGEIRDTFKKLHYVFEMPELFFFALYNKIGSGIKAGNTLYSYYKNEYEELLNKIPDLPFSNIWLAQQCTERLPQNSVLHLGILNSLRTWNFFEIPNTVLSYSNVGGFGIDGCVSTLLGASLANCNKLFFGIVGDLAFFYDLNALGNRHIGKNLRIMLINNGRGIEFRNYNNPGAQFGKNADCFIAASGHYGNQSPTLVKNYAETLGFKYISASSKDEFHSIRDIFLDPTIGDSPILLEIFTQTEDESQALQLIRNIEIDSKLIVKSKLKTLGKQILGETIVNHLKNK